MWALDYLARTEATTHSANLTSYVDRLIKAAAQQRSQLGAYGQHASLHFGATFPALLEAGEENRRRHP
jgi:hypothetical protein